MSPKARLALALVVVATALIATLMAPPRSEALVVRPNWWGVNVDFNRSETAAMKNAGGAASLADQIPDPTIRTATKLALAGITGYATWVYDRGYCVRINVTWASWWWPAYYGGWACR